MKRGAEKQLAKDDRDEDEEVDEPGQGFKKADDSVLAGRKIRGLPRRVAGSQSTSEAAAVEAPPATVPKFGSFGGFGTAASPSSFSFGAPSKPNVAPVSALPPATASPSSFSFGAPSKPNVAPASTLPPATATPSATPTLSSSASNAAKTFASFLGTPLEPKPSSNGFHPPNGTLAEDARLKAETKYYRALRGLNVSFVDAITKAVDSDPFLDIAEVLEQYKSLRVKARQEYDDVVAKASSAAPAVSAASSFSFGTPKATRLPAPPATPFSFGGAPIPSSEQNSTPPTTSSGFTFGSKPSTGTDSKPAATMPAPPSGFAAFTPPISSSTSTSTSGSFIPKVDSEPEGTGPFTFGSSSPSSNTALAPPATSKNTFSLGDSSSKPSDLNTTPSIFSSNLFSGAASKDGKEADKTASAFTSNVFSGVFTLGNKPSTSTPTKPLFGAGSSSKPFGFGSTGSIGNPIGFSFGSPPKTPDESKPPAPASAFGGFTFGAPATAKTAESSEAGGDTDVSSRADTPATDAPAPLIASSSVHDIEGEGEEDEETKHEVRTKVYRMMTKQGESQQWTDVGIGMLRVKAHKQTGTRRLLLRNSSTGKITINFNVHSGMNPTIAKNVVSFMGHDEGKSVAFKLRVKTTDQAEDLKNVLEREIEFVKSKSSS